MGRCSARLEREGERETALRTGPVRARVFDEADVRHELDLRVRLVDDGDEPERGARGADARRGSLDEALALDEVHAPDEAPLLGQPDGPEEAAAERHGVVQPAERADLVEPLGPDAPPFVRWLDEAAQQYWQLLPLVPVDAGGAPYNGLSAMAGNPLLISPEVLREEGLLSGDDAPAGADAADPVDYPGAVRWKETLVAKAYDAFAASGDSRRAAEFKSFRQRQAGWLEDYALFRALRDDLEAAAEAIDDAEVAVQERLKVDSAYLEQQRVAQESERVAVHADEKATLSEQEQDSKGESYRSDPLFMYLFNRSYGTPAYRARGLTRWLDGKVARLIGYHDARPNYARLLDLPVRLREHAEFVGAQADEEFERLKELDEQARAQAGIPELETRRDAITDSIAAVDAEIESAAEANQGLLAEAETFATGQDPQFQQAITYLSSEFGRDDIKTLRQEALTTPFPDDDVIVAQLLDLEAERTSQAQSVAEFKKVAEANRARLGELEQIRREFTKRQYDVPGSTFSNGTMVATVISQLLMGALSKESFWNVLQQQRRYNPPRTDTTFGSGGFGRGTVWGGGSSVGRDIGGQILGEVLGGLGSVLGEMSRSSGGSRSSSRGSSRSSGGFGGGSFGGTSRARSSGSRPSSSRSSGKIRGGGFKTGGKF